MRVQTLGHYSEATHTAHLRGLGKEVHASQPSGISRNAQSSISNLFATKVLLSAGRCICLEMAVPLWPPCPGLLCAFLPSPSLPQGEKQQAMQSFLIWGSLVFASPNFSLSLGRKGCFLPDLHALNCHRLTPLPPGLHLLSMSPASSPPEAGLEVAPEELQGNRVTARDWEWGRAVRGGFSVGTASWASSFPGSALQSSYVKKTGAWSEGKGRPSPVPQENTRRPRASS